MKQYEAQLDIRILAYFNLKGGDHGELHALIKRADEKALCAEATILELPGWATFYRKEGGTPPVLSDSERAVAEQILGGLWLRPNMVEEDSRQVDILHQAFQKIRQGRHRDARKMVSPVCFERLDS